MADVFFFKRAVEGVYNRAAAMAAEVAGRRAI